MSTLKQLITNGLKIGQLVENGTFVFQYSGGSDYNVVKGNELLNFSIVRTDNPLFMQDTGWKITTAYDSGINPDNLPIEEPFATGWAIYTYFNPQKIIRIQGNIIWLYDFYLQEVIDYEIEYCTPCLPPNNEKI